ncbi:MAG: GDP-mannose 4,6-dehydratase [Oscillospiraceae bacterium]|nr:GDP-mannose 4,6-dehydratase [Oscillospiraceae bacterium]
MKALIIGAAGFVGGYLARHLKYDLGWETILTKLPDETIDGGYETYDLDILHQEDISALLESTKPDVIFHLAAQSSVALSWKKPRLTAAINVEGCIDLLEAVRSTADIKQKILLIGSGEEYGYLPEGVSLVSENTPVNPGNPYAATKAAQNMLGTLYARSYGMDIVPWRN